ncbi:MAG: exosortase A [Geminicoccaceae bacterium]
MTAASTLIVETQALNRRHRLALIAFLGLLVVLLIAMADTVKNLVALWSIEDGFYSYGFLILPISVVLIWRRRPTIKDLPPRQEPLAIPMLALTGALWLVAKAADIAVVQYVALVASACLLVFAVYGRHIVRRLAFPLAFLFFMVPFGAPLLPALQSITTSFADGLLRIVGIPTYRDGTLIETSFGLFNIAEECAGLQFLAANLVAGVLFAHLAFSSLPRQVLVLVASIVAPVLVNGLRAFGIIAAVHLSGDVSIAGLDHLIYGWVLFVMAVAITFVIGAKFADWPRQPAPATLGARRQPWHLVLLLPILVSITFAPAYVALVLDRAPEVRLLPPRLELLFLRSCDMADAIDDNWSVDGGNDRIEMKTAVRCNDRTADILLVHGGRYQDSDDLVYRARRWDTGGDWRVARSSEARMDADRLPDYVHRHNLVKYGDQKRRVYFWYWLDGEFIASERRLLMKGITGRLLGRSLPFALLAISLRPGENDDEASLGPWLNETGLADGLALTAETAVLDDRLVNKPIRLGHQP